MLLFPNAKINLGLNITEKRADGFHNLESVFYPVAWTDVLEILPAKKLSFQHSGIEIPGNAFENLCLKAFHLLKNDFPIDWVHMYLHKVIPIGAGLGGGSADAAFCLKGLNEIFNLQLSVENLQAYARKLGSDCAFFIENQAKFCFGKGDEFEGVGLNLKGKFIALVYPKLHISTAEAYQSIVPKKPVVSIKEIIQMPVSEWKNLLKNDFETPLFEKYPVLSTIKNQLYRTGALYASMSGSGSTVFGIFEEEVSVRQL
ncbi:MAG: 4-(cytidine 5'-diphospho)-2-C-methyl-D-erythritol kinase, partial [Verrucomicrobia bacterium]|nr:4-(cytidine 5'-diphospho)-2-C-methyl-D-erythritol kinase [Cytophagales bacterium]